MRRIPLLAIVLVAACSDQLVSPRGTDPVPVSAATTDDGPPRQHHFGPDSYRVGLFTGEGITEPGLSCTTSGEVRDCRGFLASAVDGARLDVTLQIPTTTPQPVPLVVVVHGYAGSKSSSGDIVAPLLEEGYAVLRYSTRGFGKSWGQVNLADVNAEIGDLRSMIAQVVDVPDLGLNADAIAVTGASYGGGHSWLAALEPTFPTPAGRVARIRTVVPIAAWSDLLYSLLPNGRERESIDHPGALKLTYVNGLYASGIRRDAERPYPNYPDYFVAWHAWLNVTEPNDRDPVFASIVDGLAGYRSIWWQQAFWKGAARDRLPVFMVQGFTDDLFPLPEAKRMLLALQSIDPAYPAALYLGDIGHPRASNKPGEVEYVLDLIRQWLAYYLKGTGPAPPNVVYAALTRPREEDFQPGNVITVPTLQALATGAFRRRFDDPIPPAVLVNPVPDLANGLLWDPFFMEGWVEASRELRPYPVAPPDPIILEQSLATYDTPLPMPLTIAGQPTVTFRATTSAYRVQLDMRLVDVDPGGTKRLITRGTATVEGRTPGVPLGTVDVTIPSYGNYYRVEAGHILRLELTNVDAPYLTPSRIPSATLITGVQLDVPVR